MRLTHALLAALAGLALAVPATAQQSKRGNDTLKKYCTGDYLNYCGNLDPDAPATDACMQKNWKQLSENCRRAINAYQAEQEYNKDNKDKQGAQGARDRRG
ncbi:3',5'-cyclic-nucleotide phosphodiesterase [Methylobacterium sp. NEAU 140]|uniref:3',5'-cyclic-nucleotide phosphodiesterase n=1 Tax=Methylobacterium sp. NEAU 140 TaxID=3064945 RepID=UPI0027348882|nr:3',5'-cyclic-nucleotide phosphodiesterase [Methylobacterium sp. NEAU 140]MDP4021975.1 3',5'-cyclic-nucleotide phosphodiesterase [Methylobacterium sp. NEAU 140]